MAIDMSLYTAGVDSNWGTGVVVVDTKGRILIGKRSDDDTWCVPGGAVDPGETPVEGAHREVIEECGVNFRVDSMEYLGFDIDEVNGETWATWMFTVTVDEGTYFTFQPSEFSGMLWMELDKVMELKLFKPCAKLMEVYSQGRKK